MGERPEFVYDEGAKAVLMETAGTSNQIYTDVDRDTFELIKEVDAFVEEASHLNDDLFQLTINEEQMSIRGTFFEHLNEFQHRAADHFRDCVDYQESIKASDSRAAAAMLKVLYKLEKFLKHYFRALTIGQSLAFSQRLSVNYGRTKDYVYLYGFVHNTCSTMEYLGKLMTNRMNDEGKRIALDDQGVNASDVYQEIKKQGLDKVLNEEQIVRIPPTGEPMEMKEIALSAGSMKYLWKKRCDIVHNCPLVVGEVDTDHLPEEIVSASLITENDVFRLTHLAFRLHYHTVGMFITFAKSYLVDLLEAFIEALYQER